MTLRVYDWLSANGWEATGAGDVNTTVSLELERRRSFIRTREAAQKQKNDGAEFDFSQVDLAMQSFGWSAERKLRPHQRIGVAHALTAINVGNFSVPGAGKTTTTLAAAVTHLQARTVNLVVVVGPLACFDPWEKETRAAVGSLIRTRRVRGTSRQRQVIYQQVRDNDLLLLSYPTAAADQMLLLDLFSHHDVMLIVDESHRVKRFRGGVWAPALVELSKRAKVRMVLSGTPMPQSGKDLFTQLNILWPDGQLTGTREAFAGRIENDFDNVVRDVMPFVSRTPKSALGLPPYRIHHHSAELSGIQAEIYELIENRFRQRIADAVTWQDKIDSLRRGRPIRLLQAASNPLTFSSKDAYFRLPQMEDRAPTLMERLVSYGFSDEIPAKSAAALELIRSIADRGEKVVCWSNFVVNLDHFRSLVTYTLGIPCYQIDGRVPAGQDALHSGSNAVIEEAGEVDTRESIIERFLQETGPAVLVTNPASCSESISLHSSCHNAIYLDRTYDCAMFLQSIDRIHRLGLPANATVNVHIINASINGRHTVDALVDASLTSKSQRMQRLLEGAELLPIELSEDPSVDAEGNEDDLKALLRYLLGQDA
ncbi:SNF2-related protein [Streptomyces sudanensis]|uniref:SNF2-related protein n=1 Tax=Streptomyces sudanensis TaxID=436397 RepID=UPI0020CD5808|nr:DEAD/DEAH box helicase [Streptomyces sudanensis]MCP9957281.1 DEAD/DEAH box helicase [Streptomyces sudanensis]MCQ0002160.1 DEAD/DEAH box helicase [Streptomyces sudanensis]